jgi:hypothetical protein
MSTLTKLPLKNHDSKQREWLKINLNKALIIMRALFAAVEKVILGGSIFHRVQKY